MKHHMDDYLDDEIEIVCVVCGVVNDWSTVCMDCANENQGDIDDQLLTTNPTNRPRNQSGLLGASNQ